MPPATSLCERCRHLRVVVSAKGSRFLRCALARTRPELPKYPPQPVLACAAFEEGEGVQEDPER